MGMRGRCVSFVSLLPQPLHRRRIGRGKGGVTTGGGQHDGEGKWEGERKG
jgi:hypothetical protein